jgi:hypothetical protein
VKLSQAVERFVRAQGWPPGANRDEVCRRIDAWDAQVAAMQKKHGWKTCDDKLPSQRQQLLPFNSSLKSG